MMSKKIKLGVSSIIIVLSLMFSYVVYAKESTNTGQEPVVCTQDAKLCPDGTSVGRTGPKCEFVCPGDKTNLKREDLKNKFLDIKKEIGVNKENIKVKRDEFKKEIQDVKDELAVKKEEIKSQLGSLVNSIKTKRQELKAQIEANKEEVRAKIDTMRSNFKESLGKIKDENKKLSAEKIVDIILGLNTTITNNLSDKTDKIENVLVSIESRTGKAESNGLDVSAVKLQIEKAHVAIETARSAILAQSKKVYTLGVITDETTLRASMKTLRDTFKKDIKDLREKVKQSHVAVQNAATTLAKIPKVDEISSTNDETTNTTTTNTN